MNPLPEKEGKKIILNNDNDDKRQLFESCGYAASISAIRSLTGATMMSGIISAQRRSRSIRCMIWDFFRVGCIGCPMAGRSRYREFALYPTYERAYKKAFEKMLLVRKMAGKTILPEDGSMQRVSSAGGWTMIRCRDSIKCCWMMRPMNYIIDAESIEGGERHQ